MITRFAPSPTGMLHLGHAAHLVWLWGAARHLGARIVLRMEDHDRSRSRRGWEGSIVEDVRWLGLVWDDGYAGTSPDPYRQSDHPERYQATLAHLDTQGLLYGCDCGRAAIAARYRARTGKPAPAGESIPYDGHCRDRGLPPRAPYGIRVRLPDADVAYTDLLLGPRTEHPLHTKGDTRLVDPQGQFTYQLCVVADDLAQGVDLIIRGQDILSSTGAQILLARLLGAATSPTYLHHPLLRDPGGEKLSKRLGSTALASLRAEGQTPAQVLGTAAYRSGLLPAYQPLTPAELPALVAARLRSEVAP